MSAKEPSKAITIITKSVQQYITGIMEKKKEKKEKADHRWGKSWSPSSIQVMVSFIFLCWKIALPEPGSFDCTLNIVVVIEVCCSRACYYLPSSQHKHSHPSKPFHILPEFAAITDRWAVVICYTLHCQQQPQDKWLRSSTVLWTWGCASSFTQKCESCNRMFNLLHVEIVLFGKMDAICKMNYLVGKFVPRAIPVFLLFFLCYEKQTCWHFFHSDLCCFPHYFCLNVCVYHSALPMALRPPTMM